MKYLDYSQYSTYLFCPWLWYEKYVRGMQRRWDGQRSDPLCLGALTHEALDAYSKTGRPQIAEAVVREQNPTAETYNLAMLLAEGYVAKYPRENWPVERTEQPLEFPLFDAGAEYRYREYASDSYQAVAKLDGYFYVPEDTTIESGIPAETITLARGWWSREYKTKSAGISRPEWVREWTSKRQADFQILALQHMLAVKTQEENYIPLEPAEINVQGVLVSVLEKPREYTPRRKCKGCGDTYDLAAYLPHADGYLCPMCGCVQQLKRYEPKVEPRPEFWRMTVTRNPEQLAHAKIEIIRTAYAMEGLRTSGPAGFHAPPPNRDNCYSNKWHRPCEFADAHTAGAVVQPPDFVQVEDPLKYIGLSV